MNPQSPPGQPVPQAPVQKPKNKLQQGVSFITRWVIQGITVTGKENYTKIPQNAIVIFAAAALQGDVEVFCAAQGISEDWNVVVATNTVPQNVIEQGIFTIARFIGGTNSFFSLSTTTTQGELSFSHPKIFTALLRPIQEQKAVVIAATHYTSEGILQKEPTIDPVYLASVAQDAYPQRPVIIVPVATTIQLAGNQRTANVMIGTPIQLGHVDAKAITSVLQKKPTERTPQDYEMVKENALKLRQQGSIIMQAIASLLSPERRGIWGQTAGVSAS